MEDSYEELLENSLEEVPEDSLEEPVDAAQEQPKHAAAKHTEHAQQAKHVKKRSTRGLKIALGVLVGVLVVMVGLGYAYYHGKISLLQFDDGTSTVNGSIEANDQSVIDQQKQMESAVEGLPVTDPVFEYSDIDKFVGNPFDSDVVNILLLGTDERSATFTDAARSDTTIICSVNLKTGAIKLVSLERGMGVPVLEGKYKGEWDWLTHIFRYGGADLMMKTVSTCFDIDIQYYVRVNFNTFIQLVDSMGGVDITLSQAETDYLNNNLIAYNPDLATPVHVGLNHLNGWTALQYARTRKIDSDWVRVERQRITIRQIMEQAKTLNATELDQVLNDVLPLIKTNLTEKEITTLLLKVPQFLDAMDLEGMTLPAEGTYGSMKGMGDRSLYSVDFTKNAAILKEFLYGDE